MCVFLSRDLQYRLKCPDDQVTRTVTLEVRPQADGHFLDILTCSAAPKIDQLSCGRGCRDAIESGEYWSEAESGAVA